MTIVDTLPFAISIILICTWAILTARTGAELMLGFWLWGLVAWLAAMLAGAAIGLQAALAAGLLWG